LTRRVELPLDALGLRLLTCVADLEDRGEAAQVTHELVTNQGMWSAYGESAAQLMRLMVEAWDWLVAQGLLGGLWRPHREDAFVTRRGRALLRDPGGLARLRAGRRLDIDLHERIADRVRTQYFDRRVRVRGIHRAARGRDASAQFG
jgi:hypothetical protein